MNAVLAHRRGGEAGRRPRSSRLRRVRYFFIDGGEGGYVVVPRSFPPTATCPRVQPSEQSSNPRPGPSLSVRMATGAQWRDLSLRVVMAPARTAEEAAAVAGRLGAA